MIALLAAAERICEVARERRQRGLVDALRSLPGVRVQAEGDDIMIEGLRVIERYRLDPRVRALRGAPR